MSATVPTRPEFQFSDTIDTNNRMNKVLEIIGNHPDGLSFNMLSELVAEANIVSRATLAKWLSEFENYGAIERNKVRQGQTMIIKASDDYKKWLQVQQGYEIELGRIKNEIARLKEVSHSRKFNQLHFYEVYRLQAEMTRLPFDSYLAGLKYSMSVAKLLRDSAASALESLYFELSKILMEQKKRYGLDYQQIFVNLHVIMVSMPYFELLKGDRKAKKRLEPLRMSINTAYQRLKILV